MLTVKIKYAPGVKPIVQAHPGEHYDIRSAESVVFSPGDTVKIKHGFCMELPPGYEAKIEPRSSTFDKYGLIHVDSGVIDNDWRSEWCSTFYATRYGMIRKNARVCQFRFQRIQEKAELETVDFIEDTGRGGYGSTGEE